MEPHGLCDENFALHGGPAVYPVVLVLLGIAVKILSCALVIAFGEPKGTRESDHRRGNVHPEIILQQEQVLVQGGSTALHCRDCPPEQHCPYKISNDDTVSTKTDQCVYNADHDVIDNSQTIMQFGNGLVVSLGMYFFPSKAQNSRFMKISGSKGDLWGKVKENIIHINPRFDRSENQHESFIYKIPEATYPPAKHLFDALIEGIIDGKEIEPGLAGSYWSMIMVVGAQRAMETHQVVEFKDLTREYPYPS